MKALRIREYNAAPVVEDVDLREIGPSEVLVRVTAASLNPLDVKMQLGYMDAFFPVSFPYILGTDLAGTIERTGSLATHWRAGEKVIARVDPSSGGAIAEFVIVPSDYLVRAPASVSLTDAAGLATGAGTAWQALYELADLRQGQTVLIHAGAGGVGSFAIQLARSVGARVIATASGAGLDIVRRLGADQVIDYSNENFAEKVSDVDVVLDTIGGETQQASYGVLRTGGLLLATASPPDEALAKAHNVTATFVFHSSDANRLAKIAKKVDEGALKILVDSRVPLADAVRAFDDQGSGRAKGKIVISME